MSSEPIVFVNVGWMERYEGISDKDPITGGFGYFRQHAFGHEAWNFAPLRGRVYGYVPRSQRINLRKLGARSGESEVNGVTVVWIARHPSTHVTKIVGWYLDATVRESHWESRRAGGHDVQYQIEAPEDQATLLQRDQRLFDIPTAKSKGNLGQSPVWYGGTDAFRDRALRYVHTGQLTVSSSSPKSSPRNDDPEARKRIELAAVQHAVRYYESDEGGRRHVQSVERDAKGWDLTVTAASLEVLKVEVKGLSGRECVVELTHNEYRAMLSAEHRDQYVVYIVTEADSAQARSHVFRFDRNESTAKRPVWLSPDGRKLRIQPLTAARLSIAG